MLTETLKPKKKKKGTSRAARTNLSLRTGLARKEVCYASNSGQREQRGKMQEELCSRAAIRVPPVPPF